MKFKYLAYCMPDERLRLAELRASIIRLQEEHKRIMSRANWRRQNGKKVYERKKRIGI